MIAAMTWIKVRCIAWRTRYGNHTMDKFAENPEMKAYCQGFYRETSKYLTVAYLRSGDAEKAAEEWKRLNSKIDEYLAFCEQEREADRAVLVRDFGEHAAENTIKYSREYIDGKLQFMLGQLKSWCEEEVFAKFEKLI